MLLSNRADPDFNRIDERVTRTSRRARGTMLIKSLIIVRIETFPPWLEQATSSTKHPRKQWFNKGACFYFLEFASSDCLTNLTQLPTRFAPTSNKMELVVSGWKEKDTSPVWLGEKKERERERREKKIERRGGEQKRKNGKERTVSWIVFCNAGFQVERRTGKAARSLRRKGGALTTDFPFNRFALRRSRDQKIPDPQLHKCVAGGFRVAMKIDRFYSAREKTTPFRLSLPWGSAQTFPGK